VNPLLQAILDAKPGERVPPPPSYSPLAPRPQPIQKLRYSHEAMIDIIIGDPWISQNELADRFGMSASWISTIICSDIFQSRLAQRRDELVDPELRSNLKTQFEGLLSRSMEILRHKLDQHPDKVPDQLAVQVAKISGQSLGMGVREARTSVQETHIHLEELGNNLVSLLRRRRSEVVDGQVYEGQSETGLPPGSNGSQPAALSGAGESEQGQLPASHGELQPAGRTEVPSAGS